MNKKLRSLIMTLGIALSLQLFGTTGVFAAENLENKNLTTDIITAENKNLAPDVVTADNKNQTITPQDVIVNKENVQADINKIANAEDSASEKVSDKNNNSLISNVTKEVISKGKSEIKVLPEKHDVFLNKNWKIVFNTAVDSSTIKDKIKMYKKGTNTQVKIALQFADNNKVVFVNLSDEYKEKEEYSLVIDSNIKSKYGRTLKNSVVLNFDTDFKMNSVQTINDNTNFLESYAPPSTTNVTMSNGSARTVSVKWDTEPDTSKEGMTSYKGTIDGCSIKASLNLNVSSVIANECRTQSELHTNLIRYILDNNNRESIVKRAIELHNGVLTNNCVFTASEALRRVGMTDLSLSVCNTGRLDNEVNYMKPYSFTYQLQQRNWVVERDFSKLLAGDICFTRDYGDGIPTHTYTFIKWVKPNDYSYAYIFDNQRDENGSLYHIRNINFQTSEKDITTYYMHI